MNAAANRMRKIGALVGATRYELVVDQNPFMPGSRRHGWWGMLLRYDRRPQNIAAIQRLESLATNTFFYELNGSGKLKLFQDGAIPSKSKVDIDALLIQGEAVLEEAGYFSNSRPEEEIKRVVREVIARRGQADFRSSLLEAYAGRCLVTGCSAEPALEAAHVVPYAQSTHNDPENGLLLRADIHTLFDLGLLRVNPGLIRVEIAVSLLTTEYGELNGQPLVFVAGTTLRPRYEWLKLRYESWQ